MTTFIFPSQKKKPEEERIVSELKHKDMEGDYNVVFKNVPHFEDEETGQLYIPNPVRVKMKQLFRENPKAEEIEMPSYESIMENAKPMTAKDYDKLIPKAKDI